MQIQMEPDRVGEMLLDWIRLDHRAAYAALQDEYDRLPEPLPRIQKPA